MNWLLSSLSSSLSSSAAKEYSGGIIPFDNDYDPRVRECQLQVITRDPAGPELFRHIGVFFVWEDRKALYEAFDHEGTLTPYWEPLESLDQSENKWRVEESFPVDCSPKQVNTIAKNLSLNTAYALTNNNCHTWALALAKELGVAANFSAVSLFPSASNIGDSIKSAYNSITTRKALMPEDGDVVVPNNYLKH